LSKQRLFSSIIFANIDLGAVFLAVVAQHRVYLFYPKDRNYKDKTTGNKIPSKNMKSKLKLTTGVWTAGRFSCEKQKMENIKRLQSAV
jgi:hypothetical protein